ncbi:polysaccharide biosynthesis/export family protein [Telmatobacter sp. DSM 110680]|uniref:Polysaccharide biosynthesis/export family protein n=1 Tax=Telmatobacter sp. DSM 110680 TaxID=3036704 RepID=A0AAU7DEN6_9BACT
MLNSMTSSHFSIEKTGLGALALGMLLALGTQPASIAQATQPNGNQQTAPTQPEGRIAPSATTPSSLVSVPEDFASLKLGPGFLLNVLVYDEPDFSGPARVDSEGNVNIAFLKPVHIGGDTVAQAKQALEKAFKDQGILKNPQISIDVQQFATTSATVIGEVQTPGKVELLAPHSLLEVIGMTGGETQLAGNEIEVKRADGDPPTKSYHYSRGGDASEIRDVMVHPGDTIIVKRAGVVYVLGAVNRPGGYAMQEQGELNVAQAISLAQGLALQAKVGALRVVQKQSDGKIVEIPISYKKIMDGKEAPLMLSAGDIVYVPVSRMKTVLSSTTGVVAQTTSAAIYVTR